MPLHLVEHPLVQHKLTMLRDKETGPKEFRELVEELALLLTYELTRDLPLVEVEVETPLARTKGRMVRGERVSVIPILRAGLGMLGGVLKLLPAARVGHIGLYRDPETLEPVQYYGKFPPSLAEGGPAIVLDPMLATGGSAAAAVDLLRRRGARDLRFMCLVATREGIERVEKHHPEVAIYAAAVDPGLNEHAYIVPGLGDAGDRLFGTR
ncbi:MAG: uracil phosphoribosyltransferase [Bacillota bacterium]|nr:uracil phosphoribosyltransferase [Bacillota bacterium]